MSASIQGLYNEALAAGVATQAFWDLSPAEIVAAIEAWQSRNEQNQDEMLRMCWQLGRLIGLAVNNPQQYPSCQELLPIECDDLEQSCRALAMELGGEIKNRSDAV